MKKNKESKFTAIDLFCGAGGVTVGLKKAGFKVLVGVEIDKKIGQTFKVNHPDVNLIEEDIRNLNGKFILKKANIKHIDFVVGCPPCQGFSKLTDKWHRDDERNNLILEMARIIEEINPTACMMENVFGLAHRGKSMLQEFINRLTNIGYNINWKIVQLADFGIPQSRRRVVLFATKKLFVTFPKQKYYENTIENKNKRKWKILKNVFDDSLKSYSLSNIMKKGSPKKFNWQVHSDLLEITKKRLEACRPGGSRYDIPDKLKPKCHKNIKGFQNVYTRLSWYETPSTITSGFMRPCMGRFGHPSENRALSVREAALIQTFPKKYKFETDSVGLAGLMIGNALPCEFARIAANRIKTALKKISKNKSFLKTAGEITATNLGTMKMF